MDRKMWLEKLGGIIDAKDSDGFSDYLTIDGTFRFGNQPEVQGKQAIKEYVSQFFTMIQSSKHEVINYWEQDHSIIWQGKVTYTRLDKKEVSVDFCNIFAMEDGLISKYLIYIDNTPLFA